MKPGVVYWYFLKVNQARCFERAADSQPSEDPKTSAPPHAADVGTFSQNQVNKTYSDTSFNFLCYKTWKGEKKFPQTDGETDVAVWVCHQDHDVSNPFID